METFIDIREHYEQARNIWLWSAKGEKVMLPTEVFETLLTTTRRYIELSRTAEFEGGIELVFEKSAKPETL